MDAIPRLPRLRDWVAGAFLAAAIAAFSAESPAQATVTVGSDLSPAPTATLAAANLTVVNSALPGARLTSPVNGTVVSWRASVGATTTNAGLRVLRPLGGGRLFVSGPSLAVVPSGAPPIPAAIPISAGDEVALDFGGVLRALTPVAGAVYDAWTPQPPAGPAPPPVTATATRELYFNAEVEPTNTFSIDSTARDKRKGTASVVLTLPNPGSVVASAAAAKRSGAIAPLSATGVGPGQVTLKLAPGKSARKLLRRKGKLTAPVLITYTPEFGASSTQTKSIKFKRKKRKRRG